MFHTNILFTITNATIIFDHLLQLYDIPFECSSIIAFQYISILLYFQSAYKSTLLVQSHPLPQPTIGISPAVVLVIAVFVCSFVLLQNNGLTFALETTISFPATLSFSPSPTLCKHGAGGSAAETVTSSFSMSEFLLSCQSTLVFVSVSLRSVICDNSA